VNPATGAAAVAPAVSDVVYRGGGSGNYSQSGPAGVGGATSTGGSGGGGTRSVKGKLTQRQLQAQQQQAQAAADAQNTQWLVQGPDGKTYKVGSKIGYSESYDTGKKKGGIGNDFYNKFKQGMLDYYMPEVAKKYGDAKDELTYRLARAGTLRS